MIILYNNKLLFIMPLSIKNNIIALFILNMRVINIIIKPELYIINIDILNKFL